MTEFEWGPSSMGYSIDPLPRVTGEVLNGGEGRDSSCRYGQTSGRGEPQGRSAWNLMEGSGIHQYLSEAQGGSFQTGSLKGYYIH